MALSRFGIAWFVSPNGIRRDSSSNKQRNDDIIDEFTCLDNSAAFACGRA